MNELWKNKHRMMLVISAVFLAVTILAGTFGHLAGNLVVGVATGEESQAQSPEEEDPGEEDDEEAGESSDGDGEEDPVEEEDFDIVHYNVPAAMRGVFLRPGTDFLTEESGEAAVKAQVDKALDNAKDLTMNTVIIDTTYGDKVIYQTPSAPAAVSGYDLLEYIVEQARERGMYTYAIFDASFYRETRVSTSMTVGAATINSLSTNLREFSESYRVDGILIDGYLNQEEERSYGAYTMLGGGMGYSNFMKQSPEAMVKTASETIRRYARGTQVGLLTDAVWANSGEEEGGSNTKAAFTSLGSGNADTKGYVEQGLVDFVAVKAYGSTTDAATPFEEVVTWWADVARSNDIPLYVVHAADKAATEEAGWSAGDQLAKQVIALEGVSGVRGSVFNSLSRLVADPKDTTTTLLGYYTQEIKAEHILSELEMTKPEATTYTTTETVVTFTGASDPSNPVTINGETIPTDESGYFTVTKDLAGGENSFVIVHKDRTVTYAITRQVDILKDISPTGSIATDGGMSIAISAWAYQDAAVSATVNGTTVSLSIDESAIDESVRDSSYKLFVGNYTAPAGTASEQELGNIVVTASWNGETKSITGASVKVNVKAKIEDGVPVVVVADQAKTYPYNTLDNVPNANYYPLPQGAMDYAVGDEIVYKKDGKTYAYYVLASNLRVLSDDIQVISDDYPSQNAISGMNVTAEGGYTYVTLTTAQKVSYTFSYASSGVSIQFHNTVQVPESRALDSNPIFTQANWSGGNTLDLTFLKSGGFMGYKGYYDSNGNLVFRFNNPPSSLSGARVAIDPGHGGADSGALGFLANYPEKVINKAIAEMLADELEARGATVLLLDTTSGMDLDTRVARAEAFEADIFLSIHNNSALNASAAGSEVYYFYPFGKALATSASANVSSQLNTANRGAKQSYYRVTLSSQMTSVLVECGFLSNQAEYEKLLQEKNQQAIAVGIADSVSAAIKAAYTGSSATGTQGTGEAAAAGDQATSETTDTDTSTSTPEGSGGTDTVPTETSTPDEIPTETSQNSKASSVEDMDLDTNYISLAVGKSQTLNALTVPSSVSNSQLNWSSSNTAVATVSSSGKVTAVKAGSAVITASSGNGVKAECQVSVTGSGSGGSGSSGGSAPTDLDISDDYLDLDTGETYQLEAIVYPDGADQSAVTWKSSKDSVATVSSTGKVTGVKKGKATITVTTDSGGYTATCEVEVSGDTYGGDGGASATATASGVTLAKNEYFDFASGSRTLLKGASAQLQIYNEKDQVVAPSEFTWKSSDSGKVKVDSNGTITARASSGSAKITATPKNGDDGIMCTITISKEKVAVTSVSFNKSSISIAKGQTYKDLKVTVKPADATATDLTWKSSNTKIAKVDENGYITGVNRGTATITATSKDSKQKATVTVEVLKATDEVDYIELSDYRLEMYLGDTEKLEVEVYPTGTSNTGITWTTSNKNVVSVDSNGNVKALKTGTATIKATSTYDNTIYEECKITVYD